MADEQTKFKAVTLAERPGLEEIFRPQKDRIWIPAEAGMTMPNNLIYRVLSEA